MIVSDTHEFGREVRALRAGRELTQEQLADAIGVNRRVIGELERGKGSVRLEIALAAARAVGLDVELRRRGG
ncbi:MAG: helix-turn-helix domain-containing protein [Actinobacteria bacterium]|nr:helix-turn-helix domain-containing protein [Actinomycetota bacterium]